MGAALGRFRRTRQGQPVRRQSQKEYRGRHQPHRHVSALTAVHPPGAWLILKSADGLAPCSRCGRKAGMVVPSTLLAWGRTHPSPLRGGLDWNEEGTYSADNQAASPPFDRAHCGLQAPGIRPGAFPSQAPGIRTDPGGQKAMAVYRRQRAELPQRIQFSTAGRSDDSLRHREVHAAPGCFKKAAAIISSDPQQAQNRPGDVCKRGRFSLPPCLHGYGRNCGIAT